MSPSPGAFKRSWSNAATNTSPQCCREEQHCEAGVCSLEQQFSTEPEELVSSVKNLRKPPSQSDKASKPSRQCVRILCIMASQWECQAPGLKSIRYWWLCVLHIDNRLSVCAAPRTIRCSTSPTTSMGSLATWCSPLWPGISWSSTSQMT